MDYGALIGESIDYSREALTGRWTTWLIFILCGLPMALIKFVFDPEQLMDKTTAAIHWEIIPWPQVIALCAAGFLLSFILSGYTVRVYRGTTPPPVFDQWSSLYLDGIKLMIVGILWFIPFLIILAIAIGLFVAGIAGGSPSPAFALLGLALLLVALVIAVVACLYSTLGVIRFARTGSIREGIRFSAISETIRTMGWGTYFIALVVLCIVGIAFSLVVMVFSVIPFIGWVLVLAANPFIEVFTARFMSRVYDHGLPQVPAGAPSTP